MGKNTKIICTVVPNPYKSDPSSNKYQFSVFLSPRLPDSGKISDYYEIFRWYEFYDFFKKMPIRVKFGTFKGNGANEFTITTNDSVAKASNCTEANLKAKNIDEKFILTDRLWKKLFKEDSPVKGWIIDEGEPVKKVETLTDISKSKGESIIKSNAVLANGIASMTQAISSAASDTASVVTDEEKRKIKDLYANKKSVAEITAMNKLNQEFHKKMSILSDYPDLLRSMGWILDFSIETSLVHTNQVIKLQIPSHEEIFATFKDDKDVKWANFLNEIDFKCPWTNFKSSDFSIAYNPIIEKEYFVIKDGFIKQTGEKGYYTIQADQFNKQRIINKLSTLKDLNDQSAEAKKAAEETYKYEETEKESLTSDGIGLYINPNSNLTPLQTAINTSPDNLNTQSRILINGKINEDANIDNYVIFGHNLDTGYRIDVEDSKGQFHSLCKRTADYSIDISQSTSTRTNYVFWKNYNDEPWISESAQVGKSGSIYVNEELCRWNNWSLTCPHIGSYPQDEQALKVNDEFNDLELLNIKPEKGTLVPLRFGKKYKFRVRVVDICGNSPDVQTKEPGNDYIIESPEYKRFDLANPPEMHFTKPIMSIITESDGSIKREILKGHEGEDLNTLIIKSYEQDLNNDSFKKSSRSVNPPRVNLSFIEQHGVIDDIIKSGKVTVLYEKACYESKETSSEIFEVNNQIPFLTDPCVKNFEVSIGNTIAVPKNSWKENEYELLTRNFFGIILSGRKSLSDDSIRNDDDSVVISLRPGAIKKGSLKSVLNESPKSLSSEPKSIFSSSVKTKAKDISFIHAVQLPVILNQNGAIVFKDEYLLSATLNDSTPSAPYKVTFQSISYPSDGIPISTTSEIILNFSYKTIICDKNEEKGYKIVERVSTAHFSNLTEDGKLKVEDNIDPSKLLSVPEFRFFEHSYEDTMHKTAEYTFEFVSRFRDYFPEEKKHSVLGKFNDQLIKNSRKPDALTIESIVPVFRWITKGDTVKRIQDTFRVYLEGDWYTTGATVKKENNGYSVSNVEKIAVLYWDVTLELQKYSKAFEEEYMAKIPPGGAVNPSDKQKFIEDKLQKIQLTMPEEYEGLLSEFGRDPALSSDCIPIKGLDKSFFNTIEFVGYESNNSKPLPINSCLLERGESKFTVIPGAPENNIDVKAAIYVVEFDFESKKFYCDIKLNLTPNMNLFFPFLKFALCRYQEQSIQLGKQYDYRFSKVTMAPQVQIIPPRELNKKIFTFKDNGHLTSDYKVKRLEQYLVLVNSGEGEFEKLINRGQNIITPIVIRLDTPVTLGGALVYKTLDPETQKKITKAKKVYLEEYECYEVDDNFQMVEEDQDYNPRNDIRKRLIFTYNIKN